MSTLSRDIRYTRAAQTRISVEKYSFISSCFELIDIEERVVLNKLKNLLFIWDILVIVVVHVQSLANVIDVPHVTIIFFVRLVLI